jgi:flagellar biosynthesis chaperone FliJ
MSEQIIKLRARVTELESKNEEDINHQINSIEGENQTYKEIISELSIKINELEGQKTKVKHGVI